MTKKSMISLNGTVKLIILFVLFCQTAEKYYLCNDNTYALIVQWIERRFPKPLIRVRFPVGVRT